MLFARFSHPAPRCSRARRITLPTGVLAATTLVAGLLVVGVTASPATEAQAPPTAESAVRTDTARPVLSAVPASDGPETHPDAGPHAAGEPGADAESSTTGPTAPDATRLQGGEQRVDPFVLIGVGFRSATDEHSHVRVRADGQWGAWSELEFSDDHRPDDGAAEAASSGRAASTGVPVSEPILVGEADGYELDLPADATDVEIFLVRETGEPVALTAASEALTAQPGGQPAAEAASEPSVRLRSSWGARAYRGTPDLGPPLRRAIVHHTVNTNAYSPAQVPALLRSIQAYHQDARGWADIGYNFVIDRFGVMWEARAGGIRNPVIGAHAANHNTGSVGVAFLGDATSSVASPAVTSYGQLIGWKLFLGGVRPGTANIMGHRDVGQSSCPGSALYARLGQIRTSARAHYDALVGPGSFTNRSVSITGDYVPLSGDFDGDADSDVLWYGPGAAPDRLWLGGRTGFTGRSVQVSGTYRPVVGDFNGDGRSDVMWYGPGSVADSVWYGASSGGFTSKSFTVGADYQPLAGDFNGDGEDDIFWYGPGTARDYLWYGTTAENFTGKAVTVDGTFSPFTGDFDGDQRTDVFWYGPGAAGDIIWYGESNGFSGKAIAINRTFVPLVGDYTGGGTDDILWYGPGDAVDMMYRGTTGRSFTHRPVTANGTFDAPFTGDWNADGRDDVFWYSFAGADLLWMATG